eukprot:Blabericola_migrator_1__2211@NODE_160_length_12527_cov_93_130417_g140_i0_p6_GENE_NODE_160_length_12527_cov_93_130417_g140_i0NODE_160_length_12527_cov_93_130417_g140_i0_p6_ORF_typecomplete_len300_score51_00Rhodanese/PF00581_20/0_049Rhodanese/PF00581_20/1_9e03_NODE_160_length_12527_cov_93_130417_g140_i032744173
MGLPISKEAFEAPKAYPPLPDPKPGQPPNPPPSDDPFELQCVSQSRFYCFVQQAAIWPDYYAMYDMRPQKDYDSNHIVGALPRPQPEDDLSWAWDMLVLLYGKSHSDPEIADFVKRLQECDGPPKGVYILEGPIKKWQKRYKVMMHKSDTADSLPGPVELVPPTKEFPATYAVHRVHFLRAKSIIARLWCTTIINISSRRLFVKTPGVNVENTAFDDDPNQDDYVVTCYMKYAGKKPSKKGKGNILIIDESGCDYAAILAGWHLIKHRNLPVDSAIASVSTRTGFLDSWYTDILESWVG